MRVNPNLTLTPNPNPNPNPYPQPHRDKVRAASTISPLYLPYISHRDEVRAASGARERRLTPLRDERAQAEANTEHDGRRVDPQQQRGTVERAHLLREIYARYAGDIGAARCR